MELRLAKTDEYEQIEDIMQEIQELHVRLRPDSYKETKVVLPKVEFLKDIEKEECIVAVEESKVVGVIKYMVKHIENPTHVTKDILYIDTLAVTKDYQRQGIGRELLNYAMEHAKAKGLETVMLQVNARNENALQMYEKCGFKPSSINLECKVK